MKKFNRINYLFNNQGLNLSLGTILMRPNQGLFGQNRHVMNRVGSIFQNPPGINNVNTVALGQPQNVQMYSTNNVQFTLGGNVGNPLIANQARIHFTNRNNALILYTNGITNTLNWGNMVNALNQYWSTSRYIRNYRNVFIVSEVIIVNQAKVLYSTQNNTSITVHYSGNGAFNTLGSLMNLDTGLIANARTVTAVDFPGQTELLFNVIRYNPRIRGFAPHIFR